MEKLLGRLKACGSLVIALSGGVDSSTLAKAASVALGDKAVAVTARSELLSADELADAKAMARAAGIRHIIVDARDLDDSQIVKNDKERCYYCKRGRFQKLVAWARENGFAFVITETSRVSRSSRTPLKKSSGVAGKSSKSSKDWDSHTLHSISAGIGWEARMKHCRRRCIGCSNR